MLLRPVLRRLGRQVREARVEAGAVVSVAGLLCVLALLGFALIAYLVQDGAIQQVDETVLLRLHSYRSPGLDSWALKLTDLGSTTVVVMVVLVASALLWIFQQRAPVLLLWVAMLGGAVLNHTLKAGFARPRPELFERIYAGQPSFPSGHAMSVVVIYGALTFVIARLGSARALLGLSIGVFALVLVLVGLSRIYLGVHYPSDVLAGFLMGLAWVSACVAGFEIGRRIPRRAVSGRRPP